MSFPNESSPIPVSPVPKDLASAGGALPSETAAGSRRTRTRHWLIVFAVALAVIQYIDRVCISQAAPYISRDLNLTPQQLGWVFSAFTLAYALFEIPCGYLGDRIGPRKVLLRIVLWWSFFTAATGWVKSWGALVVTRFLFGAGEAGCFPNLTKAFARWLPPGEQMRAQGIMWMSARWGNGAYLRPKTFLLSLLRRGGCGMVSKRTSRLSRCICLSSVWACRHCAMADSSHSNCSLDKATLTVLPLTLRVHW